MINPYVYFKNAISVASLKLYYKNRISIGWIQTFDKLRIKIGKSAKVSIGLYNQNREKLHIIVLNDGRLSIGNHCFFNINSSITCLDSIEIGDNCKFGNNLVVVDHNHNFRARCKYSSESPEFVSSPIKIGNNVWVGAGVIILQGSIIGDNCVIGAGEVVKGTIPNDTILFKGEKRVYRAASDVWSPHFDMV